MALIRKIPVRAAPQASRRQSQTPVRMESGATRDGLAGRFVAVLETVQ